MAIIIPFEQIKRLKATDQKPSYTSKPTPWNENLAELVKEILETNVNWSESLEKSSVVEFFEIDNKIHLRLHIPGANKNNLKLGLISNSLRIRMRDSQNKILHNIPLPSEVRFDTAVAHFENSILEIQFQKLDRKEEEEIPLQII